MWVMSEIRKRPRHTDHDRERETSARTSKLVRAMTVKKEEKKCPDERVNVCVDR